MKLWLENKRQNGGVHTKFILCSSMIHKMMHNHAITTSVVRLISWKSYRGYSKATSTAMKWSKLLLENLDEMAISLGRSKLPKKKNHQDSRNHSQTKHTWIRTILRNQCKTWAHHVTWSSLRLLWQVLRWLENKSTFTVKILLYCLGRKCIELLCLHTTKFLFPA